MGHYSSPKLGVQNCLGHLGGLDEPHRLWYLNTWPPVYGAVWEVVSLTGGSLWEFINWPHFQFALCFVFAVEDVLFEISVPAAMLLPAMMDSFLI